MKGRVDLWELIPHSLIFCTSFQSTSIHIDPGPDPQKQNVDYEL